MAISTTAGCHAVIFEALLAAEKTYDDCVFGAARREGDKPPPGQGSGKVNYRLYCGARRRCASVDVPEEIVNNPQANEYLQRQFAALRDKLLEGQQAKQ